MRKFLLIVIGFLVFALPAVAQETRSTISGTVRDDQGVIPFGTSKPFLNQGGVVAAILSGWQVGGTYEWQPGQLLEWPSNIFFYGNLDDVKLDNPTIDRWFNVDAGFEWNPRTTRRAARSAPCP
jgi:hypothetical protein